MSIWNELIRWWNNQDEIDSLTLLTELQSRSIRDFQDDVKSKAVRIAQSEFLLTQLPITNAPTIAPFSNVGSKFVYIHPMTFSELMNRPISDEISVWSLGPKSSRWVVTPLVPQGGIVYSPNQMPGIDSLLVRDERVHADR
jgi:hypothetical protein